MREMRSWWSLLELFDGAHLLGTGCNPRHRGPAGPFGVTEIIPFVLRPSARTFQSPIQSFTITGPHRIGLWIAKIIKIIYWKERRWLELGIGAQAAEASLERLYREKMVFGGSIVSSMWGRRGRLQSYLLDGK
ncbi:hypothetical protein FA13DRAFT_13164 [Coprinellus micaceus]|uniref:Uncharacterized protein n=1 Tax=Coprinellus micaceus TaxID=71717 RepID=A0A4Y7U199_COPMI|nr:hypothetical protein FA13DRAFT_13164 [Coprinellus micaceus]